MFDYYNITIRAHGTHWWIRRFATYVRAAGRGTYIFFRQMFFCFFSPKILINVWQVRLLHDCKPGSKVKNYTQEK
jgi:hypothetical protein